MEEAKRGALRQGWIVFIALAMLTALEFWIATSVGGSRITYLAAIAFIKAGLIVEYFMHISELWHTEEG